MQKNYFSKVLLTLVLLVPLSTCALTTCSGSEVHDVAVIDITIFPTFIWGGGYITTNVTVENQGTSYETFNLTVYAYNETLQLAVKNVTVADLVPGSNTTLNLEWLIFPFRFDIWPTPLLPPEIPWYFDIILVANFTIRVEVDVVPGEVDVADNVYVDGTLIVKWVITDFNGDGRIDFRDIVRAARAFSSYPGHPRWDPAFDIYCDGVINMRDISLVARMFGTYYL